MSIKGFAGGRKRRWLGRRIAAARMLLGWTQKKLCEESKVSHNTIKLLESSYAIHQQKNTQKLFDTFAKHSIMINDIGVHVLPDYWKVIEMKPSMIRAKKQKS